MIRSIVAVAVKELQLVWRDRPALALLFLMPAFFIVVMSLALDSVFEAGTRESPLSVVVVNEDRGPVAERLVDALDGMAGIALVDESDGAPVERATAERWIAERIHPVALILPEGLSAAPGSTAREPGPVELVVDPATQRQLIAPVRGAVAGTLNVALLFERLPGDLREQARQWSLDEGEGEIPADVLDDLEKRYGDRLEALHASTPSRVAVRHPAGLDAPSRPTATQQSVPAYTIFGVFFITLTLATSFVREEESGTATRLRVTPLGRPALLIGKLLPYALVNVVQIALMFAVGALFFSVTLGDPFALLVLSLALTATATGLGLLIAAIGRTEAQVGALAVAASITLAALGGLMVPSYVMPGPMRALATITPHAWALQGYHDVMLRGAHVDAVVPEVAVLLAFAAGSFGLAMLALRSR